MTRLGKEIRKARIDQDLTQADLQARTGIDFRHLSAIERGDIDPRWSTVLKIAHALDLNLDVVAVETEREEVARGA
jgi:transcriptional regulator with XRE-family HTH domain